LRRLEGNPEIARVLEQVARDYVDMAVDLERRAMPAGVSSQLDGTTDPRSFSSI
jgi:hypothetical protein